MVLVLMMAGPALQASTPCTLEKYAELPVTMEGTRPMIAGTINGTEARFLADSGSFFSLLSRTSVDKFKLRTFELPFTFSIQGVGGREDAQGTTVKEFALNGLGAGVIHDVQFIVGRNRSVATDFDGIIGQNVVGFADTEYDLGNGIIRLFHSKGCGDRPLAYWHGSTTVATIDTEERSPQASHLIGHARLNGRAIRVIFDTGAAYSILNRAAAVRAGFNPEAPDVTAAGLTHGMGPRTIETWIARFDELDLGGETIRNARLRVGDMELPGDGDMLLGADFFLSHRLYIASSQRRIYFTYNGGRVFDLRVESPSPQSASGLPAATPEPQPAPAPTTVTSTPDVSGLTATAPGDAQGFRRRGAARAGRREYAAAISDFDRAIELEPTNADNFYQRGLAHWANGGMGPAMSDFDAALKLKPDHIPALMERAALRLAGKDNAGARADFDAVSRYAPQDAEVGLRMAQLCVEWGWYDEAIRRFDPWIAAHPRDERLPAALNGRCWARAVANREPELALADCNAALKTGTRNSEVLDSRGLVWLRLGNPANAIADYRASLKLQPKGAWSLFGLGLAESRSGRQSDGDRDMQAAKALAPWVAGRFRDMGLAPP